MFSIFKSNPLKKLDKRYSGLLEQAMLAQRNGNIKEYSKLTFEADQVYKTILELKQKQDAL